MKMTLQAKTLCFDEIVEWLFVGAPNRFFVLIVAKDINKIKAKSISLTMSNFIFFNAFSVKIQKMGHKKVYS